MKRARLSIAAFGLVLCGALGAAGPAQAASGSISGTVTDSSHAAISDIYVCAFNRTMLGPFGGCAFTNASGNYTIEGVEPGQYSVEFRDENPSLNYVTEYYNDKASRGEADPVTVGSGQTAGIDAELAEGGQITGTVTDALTHLPIAGIEVCAPNVVPAEETVCDLTDSEGEYAVNSLATGSYTVEFFVEGSPNYITQYYNGKANGAEAESVPVTAGEITPSIDAAMDEGVQITGTLTEAGGVPVKWVPVCALDPATEARALCTSSELDGTYSLAGLPLGSYVVSFAVDVLEEGLDLYPDGYVRQYYNAKPNFAEGQPVGGTSPGVFPGIDAQLVKGPEVFPVTPHGPTVTDPPVVAPIIPILRQKPPIHKCKKGFHRKKVRGKTRCVRAHGRHHRY